MVILTIQYYNIFDSYEIVPMCFTVAIERKY